jgi:quercetin dioxygenase-like cupin family protein
MDVTRFSAAPRFSPPNHEGVEAARLQATNFATVAVADWPPGSTATLEAAPIAKIYVIIEGELTVTTADGTAHRLGVRDSVHIPAGEARAIANDSGAHAAMIVITPAAPQ